MNPTIKAPWLEALRSGKYQQGQKYLRHKTPALGECWCCLGVLADIVDPSGWNTNIATGKDVIGAHRGCQGYPSQSLLETAGISQEHARQLARLNDHRASFAEIANMIEKEL
jgi:hypothetical protein